MKSCGNNQDIMEKARSNEIGKRPDPMYTGQITGGWRPKGLKYSTSSDFLDKFYAALPPRYIQNYFQYVIIRVIYFYLDHLKMILRNYIGQSPAAVTAERAPISI